MDCTPPKAPGEWIIAIFVAGMLMIYVGNFAFGEALRFFGVKVTGKRSTRPLFMASQIALALAGLAVLLAGAFTVLSTGNNIWTRIQ